MEVINYALFVAFRNTKMFSSDLKLNIQFHVQHTRVKRYFYLNIDLFIALTI